MDSGFVSAIFAEIFKGVLATVLAIVGIIFLIYIITSDSHSEKKPINVYDKIKQVKVGLPSKELRKIMGDPSEFRMNGDSEDWRYEYKQNNGDKSIIFVTIENDTITRFFSY